MTALGAPAAPSRIDTAHIRRTYQAVIGDPWTGAPSLANDEQRAHLAGLLRGQLGLLVPAIETRLPGMDGVFNRNAARHVIAEARTALAVPIREALPVEAVYDLATLSRALLALHQYTA